MTVAMVTVQATGVTKVNLAILHLLGAARFARDLEGVEEQHRLESYGEFFEEILALATAVVVMSAAGVEAFINEQFADSGKHFGDDARRFWLEAAPDLDRKAILDKYDWFLILRGKPKLSRGTRPVQDVACLIELRNDLVHFHPEWDDEAKRHAKLSAWLEGKFERCRWLDNDRLLFPRAWASHSCAAWAVENSVAFLNHFGSLAGVGGVKAVFSDRLRTSRALPS